MTRYVCQFNIEDQVKNVNAKLLDEQICCDVMDFTYFSDSPNITVPFAVYWGSFKFFDNPENITIVIDKFLEIEIVES